MTATLDGQVALITGGGSGIGLGCARALVAHGATVVLAGRNPDRLDEGAAMLRYELAAPTSTGSATVRTPTIHSGLIHTKVCDVTDEASVATACAIAAGLGRLTMIATCRRPASTC